MPSSIHRVIEGPCTGTSWTQLTSLGARTITHIPVPKGMKCLEKLEVTVSQLIQTDAKGALIGVRLTGDALKYSPYEFLVCGLTNGTATTSGGHREVFPPFVKQCGIELNDDQNLDVEACVISGSDPGTTEVAVEAKFVAGGGKKRRSIIRYGSEATVDTPTAMDLDAESGAATDIEIPADAKELIGVILAMGGIVLATATGGGSLARFKTGIEGDPFVLAGPAMSSLNTNPGVCNGFIRSVDIPMHKAVQPKAEMEVTMEHNGVDLGTIYLGLSAEFECG